MSSEDDYDMDSSDDCAIEESRVTMAEDYKTLGNKEYIKKNYRDALLNYGKAIEMAPEVAAYYSNRAAAFMMLGKYKDALEDCRHSVLLDNTFIKGHLREVKCHIMLGCTAAAVNCLQKVFNMEPENEAAKKDSEVVSAINYYDVMGRQDMSKNDFRKAVFDFDKALEHSPYCINFKVLRAECLAALGRYGEAAENVNDILRFDGINPDAIYVRGLCLYFQDEIDKACKMFAEVLRLAPDHGKCREAIKKSRALKAKKEEGNTSFKNLKYQQAYDLYTEALAIDHRNIITNAKLYCNRATVSCKLNNVDSAIEDCTAAIRLDSNYLKAYLRRAKCYMESELFEEAVRDYGKVFQQEKTKEYKRLLDEAKLELKKSKRKDYYKILSVKKTSTEDEIKKAYKKHALLHHPDRHANANEEVRMDNERQFKEIGEAYSVLSDPKKRARFDNGQDLDDVDTGFSDPNQIFRAFFTGPGQSFSFNSGGMPSGFTFQFG